MLCTSDKLTRHLPWHTLKAADLMSHLVPGNMFDVLDTQQVRMIAVSPGSSFCEICSETLLSDVVVSRFEQDHAQTLLALSYAFEGDEVAATTA